MTDVEATEPVQINGINHVEPTEPVAINGINHVETVQPVATDAQTPMGMPQAKLEQIVVTDYIRESLEIVAKNEGFQNYDLVVDHGSGIGDGFVGIILKVIIKEKNSDKKLTVLAKIPPSGQARREQMKIMPLFEREVFVYNVMLPEFVEFQKEKKISQLNGFFNFTKVYYADFNKEKDDGIIIMEDLRESNHRMWSKFEPINFEHAKLLMTALGRLHAVSFALKAKKPELFEKYKALTDYFSDNFNDPSFMSFFENTVTNAIDTLDPNDSKKRARAEKLLTYIKTDIYDCMNREIIEPFGVVNHGRCLSLLIILKSNFSNFQVTVGSTIICSTTLKMEPQKVSSLLTGKFRATAHRSLTWSIFCSSALTMT